MAKRSSKGMLTVPKFMKDLTTNKYVLYAVAFFASLNLLGYMIMGKNICILLFILIAVATSYYTKNMIFVLAVPTLLVGFFAICNKNVQMKEGFDMMFSEGDEITNGDMTGVIAEINDDMIVLDDGTEISMDDVETWSPVESFVEGVNHDKKHKKDKKDKKDMKDMKDKKVKGDGFRSAGKKGDRIDYASTLEDAYSNLNNMIGKDGIKNLTKDTKALMNQQMELAQAMKGMQPLIGQAKDMMNSLGEFGDLGKLTQGLNLKQ